MHDAPLNARIGRTMQGPMFGVLMPMDAAHNPLPVSGAMGLKFPRSWQLLTVLLLALWPHWVWMAKRLTDGSDEPWGILALVTVLLLVLRDRNELAIASRHALLAAALLAVAASLATFLVPPIFAAGIAMLALAVFLAAALPHRPATPLASLLLLSLPIIASLQFYLGYPLRALTAHVAAPLLALAGIDARAAGAAIEWNDGVVLVDPPCAGIGMLWVGSYVAALLSYLDNAGAKRTLANGLAAGALVLVANVLRNALLFFPESGLVHWPELAHRAIGLAAFTLAIVPLVAFAHWRARSPSFAVRAAACKPLPLGGRGACSAKPPPRLPPLSRCAGEGRFASSR